MAQWVAGFLLSYCCFVVITRILHFVPRLLLRVLYLHFHCLFIASSVVFAFPLFVYCFKCCIFISIATPLVLLLRVLYLHFHCLFIASSAVFAFPLLHHLFIASSVVFAFPLLVYCFECCICISIATPHIASSVVLHFHCYTTKSCLCIALHPQVKNDLPVLVSLYVHANNKSHPLTEIDQGATYDVPLKVVASNCPFQVGVG